MPAFSHRRAAFVLVALCCALVGMTGRVAYLQTYGRQNTIRIAERQQHTNQEDKARRGSVWDRNGYALATTIQTQTLFLDPRFMLREYQREKRNLNQMDIDLRKLAQLVDVSPDDINNLLAQRYDDRYVKIAENLSERTAQEVLKLKIPGVGLEPSSQRYYPMGAIASHILGSVGSDGRGLEGVELKYHSLLAGRDGFRRVEKDARGRVIGIDAQDHVPPIHGKHLLLTLDANIQMMAEEELANVCRRYQAKNGEVVVIDPRTGEILALANYPTFNPQFPGDSRAEERLNRALVVPYEPGSTLKPFIVGPALAQNLTRLNEVWSIPGISFSPYGSRRITDVHFYGDLSTWDVLVKSSNIGMSLLAARMGNARLHGALRAFGFGERTGIELSAEDQGLVRPLRRWSHFSTESVAQGYEMMVTPLQLARAFSAYANGGRLVTPTVVRGILDSDGSILEKHTAASLANCPQVIDPVAAAEIRHALTDVVVRGTAQQKGSKYWNIFGKTGTAHISKGRAGYAHNLYNSSFIGGAPYENPRIVVVMVVHEPDRSLGLGHYGGTVSAPPAVRLIERTLGYLQVPASPPLQPPPPHIASKLVNFNPKMYPPVPLPQTME